LVTLNELTVVELSVELPLATNGPLTVRLVTLKLSKFSGATTLRLVTLIVLYTPRLALTVVALRLPFAQIA
jgi:hypothetical protein